jgi:hypothetical protein
MAGYAPRPHNFNPNAPDVPVKLTATLALIFSLVAPLVAQDRSADEKAIRDLVAKINAGVLPLPDRPVLPDTVFWSGALVKAAGRW